MGMTDMWLTFKQVREANTARQLEWKGAEKITLEFLGVALAGEVGEACNVIKKLVRHRLGIAGNKEANDELIDKLASELADAITYIDLIAAKLNIHLDEAYIDKFNRKSKELGLETRI
jgi:NTP pyrophosphatase (non-canonical NTP hydrolase)